uniref:Kinesin motor domain-containing protein n=1 Tax=Fagus sylvatica TaxID=28930 RepID=A0A2N9GQA1_FAGSY
MRNPKQVEVYEFLALPIVRDAVNGINGTIITYGQTGAGKTYSMEGPGILECGEQKKGILPRVVDGLFEHIKSSDKIAKYSIKLSMVEIYMEKVRDLFDLSKDNIQIKESKVQGILLSGATEGQKKLEKTGAEGRVLEEAKMINKSLSALGNVINALTCGSGRANHIPYRDSKLTRILQDALGGNSRTALLCCCSPSLSNAAESLSTLRFGARAKHIKASPRVNCIEEKEKYAKKHEVLCRDKDESCKRILDKLRERLDTEDVKLLEELFILEGIFFDPYSVEELESSYEDVTLQTISSLQEVVEELVSSVEELKKKNKALKARVEAAERLDTLPKESGKYSNVLHKILCAFSFFKSWIRSFSSVKMLK